MEMMEMMVNIRSTESDVEIKKYKRRKKKIRELNKYKRMEINKQLEEEKMKVNEMLKERKEKGKIYILR